MDIGRIIIGLRRVWSAKDTTRNLGIDQYKEVVVKETPIGKPLMKMSTGDREKLRVQFNTCHYLAKKDRPYSDYPGIIADSHI